MTKVAVIGSRSFNDKKIAFKLLDRLAKKYNYEIKIISGGAIGADTIAKEYALSRGYEIEEFIPNWGKYGKRAGFIRNETIWNNSDVGIAFWDGESRGTVHSFQISFRQNKPLYIWNDKFKSFIPRIVNANIFDYIGRYKIIGFFSNGIIKEKEGNGIKRLVMDTDTTKSLKDFFHDIDVMFGEKIGKSGGSDIHSVEFDVKKIIVFQSRLDYNNPDLKLIEDSIHEFKNYLKNSGIKHEKVVICFSKPVANSTDDTKIYQLFKGLGIDLFKL